MKKYRVKIAVKTLEIYEVEAESPEDAAECWHDGTWMNSNDEALESEVIGVVEI